MFTMAERPRREGVDYNKISPEVKKMNLTQKWKDLIMEFKNQDKKRTGSVPWLKRLLQFLQVHDKMVAMHDLERWTEGHTWIVTKDGTPPPPPPPMPNKTIKSAPSSSSTKATAQTTKSTTATTKAAIKIKLPVPSARKTAEKIVTKTATKTAKKTSATLSAKVDKQTLATTAANASVTSEEEEENEDLEDAEVGIEIVGGLEKVGEEEEVSEDEDEGGEEEINSWALRSFLSSVHMGVNIKVDFTMSEDYEESEDKKVVVTEAKLKRG